MANIVKIDITNKYKADRDVLWYSDETGLRFSRSQLIEFIKAVDDKNNRRDISKYNGKFPKDILRYLYINGNLSINMKITTTGRLMSNNGTLKINNVLRTSTICVIIEDEGSGYIFYKSMLQQIFRNVPFVFITSRGKDNIGKIALKQSEVYKKILIITDKKVEDTKFMLGLMELKYSLSATTDIMIYYPICFEEVLLSHKKLQLKSNSVLYNSIVGYTNSGVPYYKLIGNKYFLNIGCIVHNLEYELARELYKISALYISKSNIARCFTVDCCDIVIQSKGTFKKLSCNRSVDYSKRESLLNESILGGLINAVQKIMGDEEYFLTNWSKIDKEALYI